MNVSLLDILRGGDPAAGDEKGALEAPLGRRHEQAEARPPQAIERRERADDAFERGDPVAQAGRVLEAALLGQSAEPAPQPRQRREASSGRTESCSSRSRASSS